MSRVNLKVLCCIIFLAMPDGPAQTMQPIVGQRVDIDLNGGIYTLNPDRNMLQLFSRTRDLMREVGGSGWDNDQFDRPAGVWARNGIDVFVADYGNHRIQRFDRSLNYVSTLHTRENPQPGERFGYPSDVAVSRLGDLFICDTENSRIAKVNRFTQVERTFGGFGAGAGRLFAPTQVEVGPNDRIYVVDGDRILVYDNFGNFLRDLPGRFRSPLVLYANEESVVAVDAKDVYCYDREERPRPVVPIETLVEANGIRSIAFSQDSMFIMTPDGLLVRPDPRMVTPENQPDGN